MARPCLAMALTSLGRCGRACASCARNGDCLPTAACVLCTHSDTARSFVKSLKGKARQRAGPLLQKVEKLLVLLAGLVALTTLLAGVLPALLLLTGLLVRVGALLSTLVAALVLLAAALVLIVLVLRHYASSHVG